MSVDEMETAITRLPVRDVTALLSWLAEHHAALWDKQIEYDLDAGKLDVLLAEVDAEYEARSVGMRLKLCQLPFRETSR